MKHYLFLCFSFSLIHACLNAQTSGYGAQLLQKNIRIQNATDINTNLPEFSPVKYLDGLVFVSRKRNGPINWETGNTYYELFYTELDANGVPRKRVNFSPRINNSWLNEGPVAFNREGDRIYFSQDNSQGGVGKADANGWVWMKIFEAQKGEFDWENITELPFNSDEYSCMHPTLSADGGTLYFSSNKPGGYGGMDLYIAKRRADSTWMDPINLGPDVNTNKNEVFPFIHESNTLFFSSDGHEGSGGLDLFMIELAGKRWGKVTNMGKPYNSKEDDFGLILNIEGNRGYFSSARDGGKGGDDIYIFETQDGYGSANLDARKEVAPPLHVFDADTQEPLSGAAVRVFESTEEGFIGNEALYHLELNTDASINDKMEIKMVRKNEAELGPPQYLTNRNGQTQIRLKTTQSYLILISKGGYETQEIRLSADEIVSSQSIEVELKTRNCLILSGKVKNGQTRQVVPEATVRIQNLASGKESIVRSNIEGQFEGCLEIGQKFNILAERNGFEKGDIKISTVDLASNRSLMAEIRLHPLRGALLAQPVKEGTVIILRHIYYDFNKSAIRRGDAQELTALAKLMKLYPSMEVELAAHTDSRGESAYNLELSIRRAESAKDYLIRKGVDENRITALGFGEAKISNHCVDDVFCTEDQHQFNRRTEVRITHMNENVQIDEEGGVRLRGSRN